MTAAPDTPSRSLSEHLTHQFYAWEKLGRGWQVYDQPVRPEPAFTPFYGHFLPATLPIDDGRRPTVFSSMVESLGSLFTGGAKPAPTAPVTPIEEEPEPRLDTDRSSITLVIHLPAAADPRMDDFEQFLVSAGQCRQPLYFELLGTATAITLSLSVDETDASEIRSLFTSYFPEAVIEERQETLISVWKQAEAAETLIVEFGLSKEFMLPLNTHQRLRTDPYVALIAVLSILRQQEIALFQILFEPVAHPWAASTLRAVSAPDGSSFFDGAKEFFAETKSKISRPLFAAVVRIAVGSGDEERTWHIARNLAGALASFSNPIGNELIPLSNDAYDDVDHLEDMLCRRSRRSGMLLNSEELASLVHLPGAEVTTAKWSRLTEKSKTAPASVRGHPLILGTNTHNGQKVEVSLCADQRVRHMHVIGASGTGKSTFLQNLILQDMESGQGVAVLDPHGDLIDQLIARIPQSRIKDVILVDPSDGEFPIGFNILSAHSDLEKTLLASDLVGVFRRFSTSWGDQMTSVLGNAVLAFLESPRGGTLSDLRRFLIEPAFRSEFLTTVQDSHVVYYWKKEFPLLTGKPQAPLLTRLDAFLRPKPVRYMVAQPANRLDFTEIMDSGKILLVKLAQGAIGEENAYLLGSLFVSKFHQLTLGRQATTENARKYFWLYCDEFGGYVTPSMARLLSGARKYRLGLILSHQELRQLHDPEVESALLANAGTRICFRLGDADAKSLADGFADFEAEDLRNLGTGEALIRVGRSDDDCNITTFRMSEVDEVIAEQQRAAIVAQTRERYATPRAQVEAELNCDQIHVETVEPKTISAPKETPVIEKAATQQVKEEKIESEPAPPEPPTPPVIRKPRNLPPIIAPLGKGGQQHKYLQQMLSLWAQGMGFRTIIEMPTPDGKGSIDVVLEKESRKIACEISVTSTVEQELGNLRKCLAAGFTDVFMICQESKTLNGLRKAAEAALDAKALEHVKFVSPEEVLSSADLLQAGTQKEQTVRGYKVKVRLKSMEEAEVTDRRRAVSQVLARAMRKQE